MALAATCLGVLRLRAQDRTLPLPCACQVCEEWTDGPYCTLCNVTDGSRYYKASRCMPCEEGLLADLLWKVAVISAGVWRAHASTIVSGVAAPCSAGRNGAQKRAETTRTSTSS